MFFYFIFVNNNNISERKGKALVHEDTRELNTLKAKDYYIAGKVNVHNQPSALQQFGQAT
jgi:hypothetical protein